MKLMRLNLFICLLVLLSACASTGDLSRLGDSKSAEERRLLVTFTDRSIDRALPANTLDGYRLRGQYGNSGWSEHIAQELADRHHLQFVAQWPVTTLGVSCVVYEVPDTLPVQEAIAELQQDRDVSSVQQMHSFQVLGKQTPPTPTYSDPYLHLQTGFNVLRIADLHLTTTGQGVRIAVIDTGVDTEHPDLKGRIKYSENTAPEPSDHNLADIHGTAVAGVLSAHPNNGIGIAGIAPEAEILAFRACWPEKPNSLAARCNSFTLALALNQAIRMNSDIINLSLSGPEDPLVQQLIEKALAKGIIVVAAVPSQIQAGGFPANIAGVIAVGQEKNGNNQQIAAPGKDILTTVPHQAYDFMNGSSFATPHVAGMAALLLQLHPDWKAADIKRRLGNDASTANLLDSSTALASPERAH
ncbi:S8 family peptidase [Methylomonas sp. MK1]|uniref:S8 family peptidase n=1 Tax=Methylomonas sp. MK1 TaxID=1131552 RepID=UPI00037BFA48|nr:S8 family serine peptidase [Methylomonas sp. MK1]